MIFGQAMMGAPFALVVILVIPFLISYTLMRAGDHLFNPKYKYPDYQIDKTFFRKKQREKHFIISLLIAVGVCAFFVYRLMTFEGPWIN